VRTPRPTKYSHFAITSTGAQRPASRNVTAVPTSDARENDDERDLREEILIEEVVADRIECSS